MTDQDKVMAITEVLFNMDPMKILCKDDGQWVPESIYEDDYEPEAHSIVTLWNEYENKIELIEDVFMYWFNPSCLKTLPTEDLVVAISKIM